MDPCGLCRCWLLGGWKAILDAYDRVVFSKGCLGIYKTIDCINWMTVLGLQSAQTVCVNQICAACAGCSPGIFLACNCGRGNL